MKEHITYRGIIYKYTFPNGKVYIGQTINPRSRKSQHLCKSTGARNVAFWRAYTKYGSVEYDEIKAVVADSKEELCEKLNQLEQEYISLYKSNNPTYGYNLTSGGQVFVVNDEGRKRMSDARTDKLPVLQYDLSGNLIAEYDSVVDAAKAVGSQPGNIWNCCNGFSSGKRKKKVQMVRGFIFRFKSEVSDIPQKIDVAITTNKKKVLQYTLDGKFVKEWDSIIAVEQTLNFHESGIRQSCYGKYRQSNGYMWRFRDELYDIPLVIEPIRQKVKRCFPELTADQIEKGKRICREKNSRQVLKFSFDGNYISEYTSIEEAALDVAGDAATICNACKCKKVKSAYGYQWRYKDDISNPLEGISKYEVKFGRCKPVLQYSLDGQLIKEWESPLLAADACGVKRDTIYKALSGLHETACGHIWKYK